MLDRIGEILKKKRKEQKLSLEKISEDIKVQHGYLKSIEDDPEPKIDAYFIGYLKLYANYLKVDVKDYIDDFKKKQTTPGLFHNQDSLAQQNIQKSKSATYATILILSVAVSAFTIYMLDKNNIGKEYNKQNVSTEQESGVFQKKRLYSKKINNNEYLIHNIQNKFFIIAEDSTEISLFDVEDNFIESTFLRVGEKKLIQTSQVQIKIKARIDNAITILTEEAEEL
jgi:transcriptional regulator with XRE-family HTH domain